MKRAVHKLTFDEHDKHAEEEQKRLQAHTANGANGEDDLGIGDEEETDDILSLDPKEWKVRFCDDHRPYRVGLTVPVQKQDHYAVLGLSHLRFRATDEQIKIARKSCVPLR